MTTAYLSLVRPLTEYASCVWDPHYDSHVLDLEKVQRRAARWVCSDNNYNMSVTTLLSQLHWHSLQDRRKYAKLTLFHNAIYHNTALEIPDYYMPMQSSTTRNFHHLRLIPHLTSTSYFLSNFPSYGTIYLMHYLTALSTISFLLVYLSTCFMLIFVRDY